MALGFPFSLPWLCSKFFGPKSHLSQEIFAGLQCYRLLKIAGERLLLFFVCDCICHTVYKSSSIILSVLWGACTLWLNSSHGQLLLTLGGVRDLCSALCFHIGHAISSSSERCKGFCIYPDFVQILKGT